MNKKEEVSNGLLTLVDMIIIFIINYNEGSGNTDRGRRSIRCISSGSSNNNNFWSIHCILSLDLTTTTTTMPLSFTIVMQGEREVVALDDDNWQTKGE